ncbi:MAG: iron ABC transporter permease [Armatimonadota bacterium]|nr:iron ABC transporter permease [Armatimonadota bacterium]MDR7534460.1 iron ABC transporter permease [Armatimonadota bacterium]MDR7535742.1 iron ABC transporter permease [Armatimonadota bacterium]
MAGAVPAGTALVSTWWRGRAWTQWLLPLGAAAVLAYLTVLPLAFLLYGSFFTPTGAGEVGQFTLQNYVRAYTDRASLAILRNSVVFSAGTMLVAFVIGTGLAWITERTNTPLRGLFFAVSLIPLIIPGILFTLSWIFLLSPRIGLVNDWLQRALGLRAAPFDVYSMGGMIWVEGLHWSPIVYLMMSAAFRSMDPALEEAALTAGASLGRTFAQITLRLNLPTVLGVWLVLFLRGLETFEVPAIIGLPAGIHVFTSQIYLAIKRYPSDFGLAGAYSTILLLLTLAGTYGYARITRETTRFATVTGKGFRPRVIDLGRWRYATAALMLGYLVVMVGLPLFVLLWNSLLPFYMKPSGAALSMLTAENYAFVLRLPKTARALTNSVGLSLGSATIVTVLTAVVAWLVVRSRVPGRWLLDQMASLPLIFPGVVMGVALIWVYLTLPVPIYGTVWILLIAYVTRYLPYGMRASSAALLQIHRELEEAAETSGASWWRTFTAVVAPLLRPGLLAGWIYVVIVSIRELSSSILLWGPGSEVLSVYIFDLWNTGHPQELSALGLMLVAGLFVLAVVSRRLSHRRALLER